MAQELVLYIQSQFKIQIHLQKLICTRMKKFL